MFQFIQDLPLVCEIQLKKQMNVQKQEKYAALDIVLSFCFPAGDKIERKELRISVLHSSKNFSMKIIAAKEIMIVQ